MKRRQEECSYDDLYIAQLRPEGLHLNAEMSFFISFTSSSVTPSFSDIRCFCIRKVEVEKYFFFVKNETKIKNNLFILMFYLHLSYVSPDQVAHDRLVFGVPLTCLVHSLLKIFN